ncbi:outer membrane beta-barrel protein [Pseudoduganella sp. OTU4001]|uniref:outer membrane beta-barrel protein n=1 Tax=Pseudoduganella sp. OTU4001 TaxID=3043854 RepID=UPI00313EE22C
MIKHFAAAALLAATSVAASATETPGFYMGVDAGQTKVDYMGNDTAFGVFAGYQFNRNVSVEANYRDMGKYAFYTSYYDFSTRRSYYGSVNVGMKQTGVSVLVALPVGSLSLYTRLGYNNLSADAGGVSKSKSGTLAGLGLGYDFTDKVSARLEYQRPASDVQNLSAGISYKF